VLGREITIGEAVRQAPAAGSDAVGTVLSAIWGFVGGVFGVVTILIVAFYLLIDADNLVRAMVRLFPRQERARVRDAFRRAGEKVSAWLAGQLLLGAIIGTTAAIGLWIMGVPYFYVLALIAGIGELIPIVGPLLSAIPAVIVAFSVSPATALGVAVFFFLQQQVENHVLVPKVMSRQVGISPVLVIMALLIGGSLLGLTKTITGQAKFMREIYAGVKGLIKSGKSVDDIQKMGMDKTLEASLKFSPGSKNWVGEPLAGQAVVVYEEITKQDDYVQDCTIDTDLEILIPDEYVESIAERLSLYQRLDNSETEQELVLMKEELNDRFGPIPQPVEDLFITVSCRKLAVELGFEKMSLKSNTLRCYFINRPDSLYFESALFNNILNYLQTGTNKARLKQNGKLFMLIAEPIKSMEEMYRFLSGLHRYTFAKSEITA
jgi:hypothetical protein